jgi:3-methylfumaryl-CoA hydratase
MNLQSDTALSDDELSICRTHIGRRTEEADLIAETIVGRYAAALDAACPRSGDVLPPLWHWGFFFQNAPTAELGPDGHPPRGGFMPPVRLPRRMFAGADVRFLAPLIVGRPATRVAEIDSVEQRQGKSGALVFVRVKALVRQEGIPCIEEMQTIVYRDAGAAIPPVTAAATPQLSPKQIAEDWLPNRVELFRFSAVTFNAHRIHYDLPYATDIEGYPDLVVHGPLTATRLCGFAQRAIGRPLAHFSFRGEAPLFVAQPVRLVAELTQSGCEVWAQRHDGLRAMMGSAG